MREIKFRAWDDLKKIMFDVWDIRFLPDGEIRINEGEYFSKDVGLLQYVGIKDRYGKEVYEGDIIRKDVEYNQRSYEAHYKVIYEYTGFYLELLNSYEDIKAGIIVSFPYGDFYVIGNIYENPELLEELK